MSKIHPVLLAGGSGTRLWPLSRKSYPKQFSRFLGDSTLFQSSAQRLTSSELLKFAPHITLTNSDFRFIIAEQLQEIGLDPGPILIEPEAKNTAAAILAASIFMISKDENAILLVAPSDHVIPEKYEFHKMIDVGLEYVNNGKIVTFGINPTRPESGYGYLELSGTTLDEAGTSELKKFIEKPDLQDAQKMLAAGNFLWNAGIYLFRAKDMVDAFSVYAPDTLKFVIKAFEHSYADLGFLRLAADYWSNLVDISIDYAIMEKVENLVAVPYSAKWTDLGGWDAVWLESDQDSSGNVTSQTAHAIECSNCLLRSESGSQQVVGIGLKDIVAVAMPDAVLVVPKALAQDTKRAVQLLKSKDVMQAETFPKDYRPWGWFECLEMGKRFQVKRICVKPGAALSLQSHQYRSEHWVLVEGVAMVTVDDTVKYLSEGQSVYIPVGSKHRLENPGKLPMLLIEVQIGEYLGEDDIIRYEDNYARD